MSRGNEHRPFSEKKESLKSLFIHVDFYWLTVNNVDCLDLHLPHLQTQMAALCYQLGYLKSSCRLYFYWISFCYLRRKVWRRVQVWQVWRHNHISWSSIYQRCLTKSFSKCFKVPQRIIKTSKIRMKHSAPHDVLSKMAARAAWRAAQLPVKLLTFPDGQKPLKNH